MYNCAISITVKFKAQFCDGIDISNPILKQGMKEGYNGLYMNLIIVLS